MAVGNGVVIADPLKRRSAGGMRVGGHEPRPYRSDYLCQFLALSQDSNGRLVGVI